MIMSKCKYDGTGVWEGRCIGTKEVDLCPGHDKCKMFRSTTMTNADRIRAMSDEELAKFIMYEFTSDSYGVLIHDKTLFFTTNDVMEWLKQPAKEGE